MPEHKNKRRTDINFRSPGTFHLLPTALYLLLLAAGSLWLCCFVVQPLPAQVETVEGPPPQAVWVSHGRVEGHLALNYSPAGAFSPDGSMLAVANGEKVALVDLAGGSVRRVLHPRVEDVTDLGILSASFLSPTRLFLLANGVIRPKGKSLAHPTPLLAFQWNVQDDQLFDRVDAVSPGAGVGPVFYFAHIGHLGMYKAGGQGSEIDLWNPNSHRGGAVHLPELNQRPNLFTFSPDGHWLLLAQIATNSTADPVVVRLSDRKIVDSLQGHRGTVLSVQFSRDSKQVVTTCEDGKVRIWSVPDWKLLETLEGHQGPVHWAEFSPNGTWVVSGGEDKTVRIWSASTGKLEQTLEESQAPVLSVAFSPRSDYVASSSEKIVLMWERR